MLLLIALTGCSAPEVIPGGGGTTITEPDEVLAACGNGVVEDDEQCDDGDANSDVAADACRSTCRLPTCGDAVADSGEGCDDGDAWGGDGCAPDCALEDGALEVEPNDAWDASQALDGGRVHGSLPGGDIDCFSFEVAECHTVALGLRGDCASPAALALHDPSGAMVAAGAADAAGCAIIDPVAEPGARFAAAGAWSACVRGLLGGEVPAYTLDVESGDSAGYDLPLSSTADFDGDGLIDDCDGDRDGDGLDNLEDNCPDVPNGPTNIPPTVDESGFVRHWLLIGPFTEGSSPDSCLPTDTDYLGDDDAAQPALGDAAGDLSWGVHISGDGRLELVDDFGFVDAPREVYAAVYVYAEEARSVRLALGPDDGARAWLADEVVLEVASCQGTNVDQFQAPVTLAAGWNRLLLKVYDQGGGWGTYARFLDDDGAPVVGLELSLSPGGAWDFDQTDSDGDGVGDACDDD